MAERVPAPDGFAAAIPRAIEVFVHGYAFTRSFTHPYQPERIGPVWAMRDAPRTRGRYRLEEWVAYDVTPGHLDEIVRAHSSGRFAICAICAADESQEPLRAGYRELGYRLVRTEALMVHSLERVRALQAPATIERVTTEEQAGQLASWTRMRPLSPEYLLPDSPLRQYVASVDGELVGRVRSVVVGDATWCADMYVQPEFRRRGIAGAMLCRMLRDDRSGGAATAVLLASHTGAKLYPVVGYEQIGTLLLYMPKRHP